MVEMDSIKGLIVNLMCLGWMCLLHALCDKVEMSSYHPFFPLVFPLVYFFVPLGLDLFLMYMHIQSFIGSPSRWCTRILIWWRIRRNLWILLNEYFWFPVGMSAQKYTTLQHILSIIILFGFGAYELFGWYHQFVTDTIACEGTFIFAVRLVICLIVGHVGLVIGRVVLLVTGREAVRGVLGGPD
jgi:hypothetical protein